MNIKENKRPNGTIISLISATVLMVLFLSACSVAKTSYSMIKSPVFSCGSGVEGQSENKDKIFESVPTQALALSDDGSLLFAINSPSNCLEIYQVGDSKINLVSSVAVGIDPVSVAVRSASEVWVVNHISDSVSVVSIDNQPHVKETLQVGDAPWDVVFANNTSHGEKPDKNYRDRAFISSSFRGQQHPQFKSEYLLLNRLDTDDGKKGELIGRADIWVFDVSEDKSISLAGIINTFTASLRSLAVDNKGKRVFATGFRSGNRTAITPVPLDGLVGDSWSADGVGHIEPFAIVKQQGKQWLDANGNNWPAFMNYDISDNDVFVIDATKSLKRGTADKPEFNRHAIIETVESVGSVLFNSYFDDANNRLLVSAVDANNIIPMEHNLKGTFSDNHLKVIDFNHQPAKVSTINMDNVLEDDGGKAGFALPSGLVKSSTDNAVLLTSMGTNKIVALDVETRLNQSSSQKGNLIKAKVALGPISIIQGKNSGEYFSYSYIDNSISVHHTNEAGLETDFTQAMFNPELKKIKKGRQFLYDAEITSNNDRVSCASCHIFGGEDRLQWTLSKSGENIKINYLPFIEQHPNRKTTVRAIRLKRDETKDKVGDLIPLGDLKVEIKYIGDQKGFADRIESGEIKLEENGLAYLVESAHDSRLTRFKILSGKGTWALIETPFLHPLKGPMRTTPLHGIVDSGPMHFLGDKFGLVENTEGPCSDSTITQAERAYKEFNSPCDGSPGPFETLLGGDHLREDFMDHLTAYSMALTYPPNPIRPLNNQVNVEGERIFSTLKMGVDLADWDHVVKKGPLTFACIDCHTTSRPAKLFGTSTKVYSAPPLSMQDAKVPHLRFLYDRAGFTRGDYRTNSEFLNMKQNNTYFDKVVHAQGFNHGGWFDSTFFFADYVWIMDASDVGIKKPKTRAMYYNLFNYLMEFDTNYLPMYGRQLTINNGDLDNETTYLEVATFFENALQPESVSNEIQCEVYLSDVSKTDKPIKNIKELEKIHKRSNTTPKTLTCQ